MLRYFQEILPGAGTTLLLFIVVAVISIPLGFLVTLMAKSRVTPIRWFANAYIFVLRGTPLLLQVMFIYFGFPIIGHALSEWLHAPQIEEVMRLERFFAACVGFTLNYAAYFAEIFRGGLLAIDKGQHEASKVLGLSSFQTTVHVIIPQMIRVTLPSVTNEIITLVKDTSLLHAAVSVPELLNLAQAAVNRDFTLTPLFIAAVMYLVIVFVLTVIFRQIEKRFRFQ